MSTDKVCFRSNINAAGRARRIKLRNYTGVATFAVAALLHFFVQGSGWPSTLLQFAPVFVGTAAAVAIHLEVTRKTCVVLAGKGFREKEGAGGERDAKNYERVTDADELEASKQTARSIYRDAIISGVAAGAAFVVLERFI